MLTIVLSWHPTYGFKLNNREEAALVWLILLLTGFTILVLLKPEIRSSLVGALRMAVASKLVIVWIVYVLWIILFVLIAYRVGIWRDVMTKDTLVWGATSGIAVLVGFPNATKSKYFRREFSKVISVVVVFEYIVNFSSFSFWVEFLLLQPLVFIAVIPPSIAREPEEQKTWRRIRDGLLVVIFVLTVGHPARTLYASWQTVDWSLFLLRAVWPILLGI